MAKRISTEDFLVQNGIYPGSIHCTDAIENIPSQEITTGKYLTAKNIGTKDFVQDRKNARLDHQIAARTKVLAALIVPMYVVPIWLMIMLSLPAFKVKVFSERMQILMLGALASDIVGLCYVVTRSLFSQKPEALDDEA